MFAPVPNARFGRPWLSDNQLRTVGEALGFSDEYARAQSGVGTLRKAREVLVNALQDWDSSLNRVVTAPADPAAGASATSLYDECIRLSLNVTDVKHRAMAMASCESQRRRT